MVDHGQTKVISLLYHVKLWWVTMIIHGKTIVDYGVTFVGVEVLIEMDVIINCITPVSYTHLTLPTKRIV